MLYNVLNFLFFNSALLIGDRSCDFFFHPGVVTVMFSEVFRNLNLSVWPSPNT
jgi:hypothetical protein